MVKINVPEYCKICKEEFLITIVNEQVIDDSKHNLGREPWADNTETLWKDLVQRDSISDKVL